MTDPHSEEGQQRLDELTDDGWRRMHPLSPLLRGGIFVLVVIGIVVANMRDRVISIFMPSEFTEGSGDVGDLVVYLAAEGLLALVIGGIFLALLLVVFFSWLAWRFRAFRVTAEAVEERSGILFRQHRRAPLERIQSVNLQRPLLARALGLTQVDVQTAGQGGKVSLRYLTHALAKELREQILQIRAVAQDTASAAPNSGSQVAGVGALAPIFPGAEPGSVQAAVDRRASEFVDFDIDPEAARSGSLVRVPVGRLIGSILLGWDLFIPVLLAIFGLVAGVWWHPGGYAIVVPAVLMFAGIGFGQFNRGFGFTLSQTHDGIRVGAGLTATNTETVPLRRIHAIEARQPLGWRPFGWWKVRITTAGHSAAQGGQNRLHNVVLPVGLESDVLRVLSTLGFSDDLRDALLGEGKGYVGAGPRAGYVLWFGRRRAGLWFDNAGSETAGTGETVAAASVEGDGSAANGSAPESLRIRRGALTRSLSIMPIVRAQSIQLRRPLAHRFLGLASLQAHTVLGPVRMEMRGLELGNATELFECLASTVVRVQAEDAPGPPEAGHGA